MSKLVDVIQKGDLLICPFINTGYGGAELQAKIILDNYVHKISLVAFSSRLASFFSKSKFHRFIGLVLFNFYIIYCVVVRSGCQSRAILWGTNAILGSFFLPFFSVEIIVSERQFSVSSYRYRYFYRRLNSRTWIFNSKFALNNFRRKFGIDKSVLVYNDKSAIISLAEEFVAGFDKKSCDKPVCGIVSRVHPSKNIYEALVSLSEANISKVVIFGIIEDVAYCDKLYKLAAKYNIELDVRYEENPAAIYSSFDFLLHFSQNEGMPNSVLEAVIFSIIVVCTDADFLDEIDFPTKYRIVDGYIDPNVLTSSVEEFSQCRQRIEELFGAY